MMMCKNKAKRSREKVGWKIEQCFSVGGGSVLVIQCRVLSVEFSKSDDAGWRGVRPTWEVLCCSV